MLFNSLEFAVFLPVMFLTCWFACGTSWQLQNLVLLTGSLVFYGWWDPRFLGLILLSATLDFTVSNLIHNTENTLVRKTLLGCSLLINFGILAVFKYCNFFISSLNDALTLAGFSPAFARLDLVLPVGISFYTFQTVSASIDVYRRQLQPTRNLIAWLAYITFFPQLVAGPIERAGHLLPQFLSSRRFSMTAAVDGCRQALWGLFKKVVIADNCAALASHAFENSDQASATALLAGIFLFTIQIYCDFSGYSDIAVGVARLFGFSLMQNFAFPYFSRDISEFWRRWHISLSTWFRDYVYLPLGGSRCSKPRMIRNTIVVFLVSGLWHGANWTFPVWGLINALWFLPLQLAASPRRFQPFPPNAPLLPQPREALHIIATFLITMLSWTFFRAASLTQAAQILLRIFTFRTGSGLTVPSHVWILVAAFLAAEWIQRGRTHALEFPADGPPRWTRWLICYTVIFLLLKYGGEQQDFIYFQF